MKYINEYRDGKKVAAIIEQIKKKVTRTWVLMEVCGGQTHSIIRFGLDKLLPSEVELVHGPGCPVCVTPVELIDKAITLAALPHVIFTSFGDMLRVPGSFSQTPHGMVAQDLFSVKSKGGDVRIVYSPLDAVKIARENPDKIVVFFAIGFETTAPANAMAVLQAAKEKLPNFCILVSHVTVPPAIATVMSSEHVRVNAFLAAGHVCTVMGTHEYTSLTNKYHIPIVVTGFEPVDVAQGILMAITQLETGVHKVENAYDRVASPTGNPIAQKVIREVFEVCDRQWRGIGEIPHSGYAIKAKYRQYDAESRFPLVATIQAAESPLCHSGEVLKGLLKPDKCPAFGKECTPLTPLGATMVSGEGACAAYYNYGRTTKEE